MFDDQTLILGHFCGEVVLLVCALIFALVNISQLVDACLRSLSAVIESLDCYGNQVINKVTKTKRNRRKFLMQKSISTLTKGQLSSRFYGSSHAKAVFRISIVLFSYGVQADRTGLHTFSIQIAYCIGGDRRAQFNHITDI
jgi:hypothetical protein